MKQIIIATHGTLAEGYKNTLGIICGNVDDVTAMCFYCGKGNYNEEIDVIFRNLTNEDQVIVCTDIKFGSVNQLFIKAKANYPNKNIMIVSGINLPMLLEFGTSKSIITKEKMNEIVESSKHQIELIDLEEMAQTMYSDELI